MSASLKSLLSSNCVTIICSIIIGYSLWTMLTHNQIIQENIIIPVKIYQDKNIIDKETSINVLIEGARHQLQTLINHPPQVNIYRDEQPSSKQASPEKPDNFIKISQDDILLPETLSIINYWPREISL